MKRRLTIIIATALVVAAGLAFFWYFWLARPIGAGPAGPPVSNKAFAQPWGERKVVVLGIGDSVTAGFGARPDKAFVARLMSNPADEFDDMRGICLRAVLPNIELVNVAVSGSDSLQHAEKQIPSLRPFDEEVFGIVVMTSGGNDLIHWYGTRPPKEGAMYGATIEQAQPWIANYERRLEGMLNAIDALFPGGCRIFLGNIYDPSDGGADPRLAGLPYWEDAQAILGAYNQVIARSAAQHPGVVVVDMHGTFLGHGVRCAQFWRLHYDWRDPHYWYSENIEDPNERGHDALRRIFLLSIAEQLAAQKDLFSPR